MSSPVPRVVMKGLTRSRVTTSPLTRPMRAASPRVAPTPRTIREGSPAMTIAETIVDRAAT